MNGGKIYDIIRAQKSGAYPGGFGDPSPLGSLKGCQKRKGKKREKKNGKKGKEKRKERKRKKGKKGVKKGKDR